MPFPAASSVIWRGPGLAYWEIEVEYRPTGEVFCLRWWAEWCERLRSGAGY